MTEKFLIQLDEARKWALGADSMQWIIYRVNTSKGEEVLQGRSFINWDQDVLRRVLRELGVQLSDEAVAALAELPHTFREFKELYNPKSGKGRQATNAEPSEAVSPAMAKWNGYMASLNGEPRKSPHRAGTALAKEWFEGYSAHLEGEAEPYKPEKRQPKEEPVYE